MFAHNHIIANFVIRTLKLPGMEQQKSCKIQKKGKLWPGGLRGKVFLDIF